MKAAHFILYVLDQERSKKFYGRLFESEPILHVPGMTEFRLNDGCVLGLMPQSGIKKLLGDKLPDPQQASGIPRAELYLYVNHAELFHQRSLANGAVELSCPQLRNWGDFAGYSLDPDGHVLAFAEKRE